APPEPSPAGGRRGRSRGCSAGCLLSHGGCLLGAAAAASTMPGMIDAHHHLWDLEAREHRWLMGAQPWASDDELARLRRSVVLADVATLAGAAGVTGTVDIQPVIEPWETPDLLALAAGGGLLAGVVGWTALTSPAVADAVAGLRALPGGEFLCGIRHPALA